MTKHVVNVEIDEARLSLYSDEFLATCWHVAQVNPADGFDSSVPGELAERIGREIIHRWLRNVPPALWHHQGRHYYHHQLGKLAKYEPGDGPAGSPEWKNGTWVPRQHNEADTTGGAS
jgi:hypothetical protein